MVEDYDEDSVGTAGTTNASTNSSATKGTTNAGFGPIFARCPTTEVGQLTADGAGTGTYAVKTRSHTMDNYKDLV